MEQAETAEIKENISETESITIYPSEKIDEEVSGKDKITEDKNMKKAKKTFHKIIQNYRLIQDNLNNTLEDIEKLEKVHHIFVSNAENKLRFHEYGTYVDDIYFQINLLKLEYQCQITIQHLNINKLYKDLFRLFNRLIKKLISMKFENAHGNDFHKMKDRIQQERKNYFIKIKPFNEISENFIHIDECLVIYSEIDLRISDFQNAVDEMIQSIRDADEQRHDGVLLQTFLISLKSEKEKAEIEHYHYKKLLIGILNSHLEISNKYLERTTQISKEIINSSVISSTKKELSV